MTAPEVPVEGRFAHPGERGELHDPDRVVVMITDPSNGTGDVGEVPVREPDFANHRPMRPGQEPPEHFAPVEGRQDLYVLRRVEEAPGHLS